MSEQWVDVTQDCEQGENGVVVHGGWDGTEFMRIQYPGYRLRKIEVNRLKTNSGPTFEFAGPKYAFLIERKEP